MRIDYCDSCGIKLGRNRAGRRLEYSTTLQPANNPVLSQKPIAISIEAVYGSDVSLSRVTNNNGDFCLDCLEEVIMQGIVARKFAEKLAIEKEMALEEAEAEAEEAEADEEPEDTEEDIFELAEEEEELEEEEEPE